MSAQGLNVPRLVLAGVASGVGKTTVTVALARALVARGLRVALFKCGPDYLDPSYHARAVSAPSHNLDGWMMGRDAVLSTFADAARGCDLALIEGVMGLFDGATPSAEHGSSAEIAKWLHAPAALVVDASGMARSIAALAHGFATFDRELDLAGVIANRVGSRGHLDLLAQALSPARSFGGLPKDAAHAFPERHLGLQRADDSTLPEAELQHWAALAEEWLALDALLGAARAAPPLELPAAAAREERPQETRCRIGVARDAAFHFYYVDNLRRLATLGAELVEFSPLHDQRLPDSLDGLYLGGGYPELHAAELANNRAMRDSVAEFATRGGPIYAECGGLMYLTNAIQTLSGERHEMVGLLPTAARMGERLQALGYVEVETQIDSILGPAGTRFRGHQFRYSELEQTPSLTELGLVYTLRRRRGSTTAREGYSKGRVLASYVHAHWASNPGVARALVASCVRYREERGQ